jgi:hypothetical protein
VRRAGRATAQEPQSIAKQQKKKKKERRRKRVALVTKKGE